MVDYWPTNIAENPCCPHGPTLLFSRVNSGRKFFACSAFRDRKKCQFFQWFDASDGKNTHLESNSSLTKDYNYSVKLTSSDNVYCFTCDLPIDGCNIGVHYEHKISENIEDGIRPTMALKTKEESKGESQYHFCDSTVNTFVSFFEQHQISSVLCIGCPRLYEYLLNEHCSLKSMLLDIDDRFKHFYDSKQFQLFNMFNCHFFDSKGWKKTELFLRSSSRLAVVIDPPFGGRIEALEYTLKRLISLSKNISIEDTDVLILLILPYFMEKAVRKSFPSMSMLDYKVEYKNHRRFRKRENSRDVKGSAVRIFTNYSPSSFIFPPEEGYKYCIDCDRWVCKANKHCFECKACTSKNGGRYRHCKCCNKCVKMTWKHCEKCGICKLPCHICSSELTPSFEEKDNESQRVSKKKKYISQILRNSKTKRKKRRKF